MTSTAAVRAPYDTPRPREVARVSEWLRRISQRAAELDAGGTSYLIVTPLGMPNRTWLERRLLASGVVLTGRLALPAWPAISSALQVKRIDGERLYRAALFEAVWESLFPGVAAEAWSLAPGGSHLRAEELKPALRRETRSIRIDLGPESSWPAFLHPFHLADSPDAGIEASRLLAALGLLHSPSRRNSVQLPALKCRLP